MLGHFTDTCHAEFKLKLHRNIDHQMCANSHILIHINRNIINYYHNLYISVIEVFAMIMN